MSSPEQVKEPTMEEILASIRKIISDDDREQSDLTAGVEVSVEQHDALQQPEEAGSGEESAAHDEGTGEQPAEESSGEDMATNQQAEKAGQDDIDAIMEAMEAEGAPEPQADEDEMDAAMEQAAAEGEEEEVLGLGAEDVAAEEPAAEPAAEAEEEEAEGDVMFLGSEDEEPGEEMPAGADTNSRNLLSERPGASVSSAFASLENFVLSTQSRTLEDLVTEMMRPMLRGWLDSNLPPLVERLVKEEIERVSRGRR